jgi:hypothetical protein
MPAMGGLRVQRTVSREREAGAKRILSHHTARDASLVLNPLP